MKLLTTRLSGSYQGMRSGIPYQCSPFNRAFRRRNAQWGAAKADNKLQSCGMAEEAAEKVILRAP